MSAAQNANIGIQKKKKRIQTIECGAMVIATDIHHVFHVWLASLILVLLFLRSHIRAFLLLTTPLHLEIIGVASLLDDKRTLNV